MIKHNVNPFLSSYKLDFSELSLDKNALLGFMGYEQESVPQPFMHEFESVMDKARALCDISAVVQYIDLFSVPEKGKIQVKDTIFECGATITSLLRQADSAALFLCTIGPQLEHYARELMNANDYLLGYFADHLASAMVEAAMDIVQQDVAEGAAEQGLSISNRFSPGYCGWHVSQQKLFFEFFPTHNCGITLTESCLMLPIKSVSGILGMGKSLKRLPYTCDLCNQKDCLYRRN